MIDDIAQARISFWLQEARELMIAADLCWRSDEAFQQQIEGGVLRGVSPYLLEMEVNGEVELNWLYNILAGLAVYYLAIGVLVGRRPGRKFGDNSERHIIELVEECGTELSENQRAFLRRVQDAVSIADKKNAWNISLKSDDLKLMKQRYAQQHAVSREEKLAIDGLMGKLINTALNEITEGSG